MDWAYPDNRVASKTKRQLPLIAIVGPTASGKTTLAVAIAKRFGGEIICADSRTVYRGMDIGTAKPTTEERAEVPHWGLDLVDPDEPFSAADFKVYANRKIGEIRARGNLPILVGGTGLYVDAVIFDYEFGPKPDQVQRDKLEGSSLEELHEYCRVNNITLPENALNKRYVIRAIERDGRSSKRRNEPMSKTIIVGISTVKDDLLSQIRSRSEQIFENGVVEEATLLGKKYGWQCEAMTGNVYRLMRQYLDDEITIQQVKDKFTTLDWQLAKRQLTWLRRNPYITWMPKEKVIPYLDKVLASE